jgi:hypothetical protein
VIRTLQGNGIKARDMVIALASILPKACTGG